MMKDGVKYLESDTWSLGCIILELMTGVRVWDGIESNFVIIRKIVEYEGSIMGHFLSKGGRKLP